MSNVIPFENARKRECEIIYNFHGGGKIRITIEDCKTHEVLMDETYDEVPTIGEQRAMAAYFMRNNPDCFVNNA